MTLELDVDTNLNANLTYSLTVGFEIYNLDVSYIAAKDPTVEIQGARLINFELSVLIGLLLGTIETAFDRGHSFASLLDYTPLCWLNIDQIWLVPNYQTFFLWGGITPVYAPERCPSGEGPYYDKTAEFLTHPKCIIK